MKNLAIALSLLLAAAGCDSGGGGTTPAPAPRAPPPPPSVVPHPEPETLPMRPEFIQQLWNELGFAAHECPEPGPCPTYYSPNDKPPVGDRRLWILSDPSPDFYIHREGFSDREIQTMRDTIPRAVTLITGKPFDGMIEEGPEPELRAGRVLIRRDAEMTTCGRARIGGTYGRILLKSSCDLSVGLLRHEIGHSMGFYHSGNTNDVMSSHRWRSTFTQEEIDHTQYAYTLWRGMRHSEGPNQSGAMMTAPGGGPEVSCGKPQRQ